MPRVEIVAADTPFTQHLQAGFGYPLRGAAHADQHAEAMALLERLADAWSGHPLRGEIDAQRRQLASPA